MGGLEWLLSGAIQCRAIHLDIHWKSVGFNVPTPFVDTPTSAQMGMWPLLPVDVLSFFPCAKC
ncbi:hypothetical protein lerEdw1_001182 [Lerista edwardsae]|nr:hypothetical protein lerEdw1_001184 [Lerista edwardsae]KAJ6651021.1 hypothetical protein lerEdw1_001182 [Lerista edwardsae]